MSAAERRAEASRDYNAFVAECPTRQLLDTLASKWVTLVLTALADGPRRHSELAQRIAGVSQKMLTQTLRTLEGDGLVARTVTSGVPPRVDYELTDLGRSLLPVVSAIKDWAEEHMDDVQCARGATGGAERAEDYVAAGPHPAGEAHCRGGYGTAEAAKWRVRP